MSVFTRRYLPLYAALVLVAGGCAAATSSSGGSYGSITAEQIQELNASTALDVVQQLRPHWLRARGSASLHSAAPVLVYQNGVRVGGIDALRGMHVTSIISIQHLSGSEATMRFGIDHESGAILVRMR